MRHGRARLASFALALATVGGVGPTGIPYREQEQVHVVLLPAVVEDRRGQIVRGLTRDSFQVFEEEQPQEIRYFSIESQEPLAVAFVLDLSGSMRAQERLASAKAGIRSFVQGLRPLDRVALIGFADDQVAWLARFDVPREEFLARLEAQVGYGQTALRDAVAAAPGLLSEAPVGQAALVLVTDGVDNASRLTEGQAIASAREASFPIYTLGLADLPAALVEDDEIESDLQVLQTFSAVTGGKLYPVRSGDDARAALAGVEEELRYRYVIGYDARASGGWRSVRLETRKRGMEVRTRAGYYAGP